MRMHACTAYAWPLPKLVCLAWPYLSAPNAPQRMAAPFPAASHQRTCSVERRHLAWILASFHEGFFCPQTLSA